MPPARTVIAATLAMSACKKRPKLLNDWRDAVMILAESIGQLQTCNVDRFEARSMARPERGNSGAHCNEVLSLMQISGSGRMMIHGVLRRA